MPIRENTEARRRATANYQAKRRSEGWVRANIWFCPETLERLNRLLLIYNSRDAAIEAAVEAFSPTEDAG